MRRDEGCERAGGGGESGRRGPAAGEEEGKERLQDLICSRHDPGWSRAQWASFALQTSWCEISQGTTKATHVPLLGLCPFLVNDWRRAHPRGLQDLNSCWQQESAGEGRSGHEFAPSFSGCSVLFKPKENLQGGHVYGLTVAPVRLDSTSLCVLS